MEMKITYYYLFLLFAFHLHLVCASVNTSGFISIDCGSNTSTEFYGLHYGTDAGFIESGENHNISADNSTPDTPQQLLTLRSFPNGKRNCYNLSIEAAAAGVNGHGRKGNKYLIRVTFMYGNYDGKNQYPVFDMYLGVDKWVTISEDNYWEIIHVPTTNYVYLCFVNTGQGTPFISLLELRPLNAKAYNTTNNDPQDSLEVWGRLYVAQQSINQTIRYPDDIYDRQWTPWNFDGWKVLRTEFTVPNSGSDELPPSIILQSAAESNRINDSSLQLTFKGVDAIARYAFCFYFSELEQGLEQDRQFVFYFNNNSVGSVRLTKFLQIYSLCFDGGNVRQIFNFTLQKTAGFANPVFSAVEFFKAKQFLQSQTDENDGMPSIYYLNFPNSIADVLCRGNSQFKQLFRVSKATHKQWRSQDSRVGWARLSII